MKAVKPNSRAAIGYVELLIALAIAVFCLVPMIASSMSSIRGTDHSGRRILAITLTNGLMQRYGALSFDLLKEKFGQGGTGLAELGQSPIFPSDLQSERFAKALEDYRLVVGEFEEIEEGKLGLLTFAIEYPAFRGGPKARVSLSKVVPNFAALEWGKDV